MNTAHHPPNESQTTNRNRDLIEDLCSDCCRVGHYCTLKEITARAPRDARIMIQIKCIEKFKYERSQQAGHDIGWNEAFLTWIQEGFADRFSRLYHSGVQIARLYGAVMEGHSTVSGRAQAPLPEEKQ